jgi:transcriptional regulator with XRE-family HTH domain
MNAENTNLSRTDNLGIYLKNVRLGLGLTLRQVEETTNKDVSNAYLSQLETGKIAKPSPHILYSLAQAYDVSYESLMERAGYIAPSKDRRETEKHGSAATFAIEHLSADEERALLKYLAFVRSQKGGA